MARLTSFAPGAIALAAILSISCSDVSTGPSSTRLPFDAASSKGGGSGGGNGGGGNPTVPPLPSPLPTTSPAPGVLLRESFGLAALQRPQGDKGTMRDISLGTNIAGFWLEYPGSRSTQWITPGTGQAWKFAACSTDPYEMPSPLQTTFAGCVVSDWRDGVASYPTALMPLPTSVTGYELSMDGYPAPIANAYVAIGFTSSSAVTSNLTSAGDVWLRVRDLGGHGAPGPLTYELRVGGLTGTVLASGTMGFAGWNRMSIRVSPATSSVTLAIADSVIGTYHASIPSSRYAAFEGIGVLDNFVVRE